MNENDNLSSEVNSELPDSSSEINFSGSKNEINSEASETSDSTPSDYSEPGPVDKNLSDEEIEEKPSSTVIQVVEDSDSDTGYTVNELDVKGLNEFIEKSNETKSVNPTSNDYYTFIEGDILEYIQGLMSHYPLNDYRACHLRHWIQNTQYYSYYDDYYYLWFDYPDTVCYEIIKYNGQSNYVISRTTQSILNANIMYGSDTGTSDLRKGVSYVQEMGLLCAICVCLVLYILHAIFKHLAS